MIKIYIYKRRFFEKAVLGIDSIDRLDTIIKGKSDNYVDITVFRNGKLRNIKSLKRESKLYMIQKNLSENFLSKIPLPENVCGFVKDGSYKGFLQPHLKIDSKDKFYLRLDIKDFFNSISEEKIQSTLDEYITINESAEKSRVIKSIVDLVTLDECLPQGGVTSPVVSNLVFRRLDIRIRNYCDKLDVTYTRYADDMLFSAQHERLHKGSFIKMIIHILKDSDYILNRKKIKRGINLISLNGFVVGENVRISRGKRKDINRFIFHYEKGGIPKNSLELIYRFNEVSFISRKKAFESVSDIIHYLAGYRSLLIQWLPENIEDNWYKESVKLLEKIEKIILRLDSLD